MVQAGRPALCASPETAGHEAHHSKALMIVKPSFTHSFFSLYMVSQVSFLGGLHVNNKTGTRLTDQMAAHDCVVLYSNASVTCTAVSLLVLEYVMI